MKNDFKRIALALALTMPVSQLARAADATPPKPTAPNADAHITLEDLGNKVLPNLRLNNNALNDVLDFVRDSVPGFQYTLTFDQQANVKMVFPAMNAQGLTLNQFMDVLHIVFPEIEVTPVIGPNRPLYVIHVGLSAEQQMAVQNAEPIENQTVKVCNLHAAIDTLLANKGTPSTDETRKAALGDLLGLVNTALGESRQLNIQIHQPTETLIFHGSANKAAILQQLLSEFDATHAGEITKGPANYAQSNSPATRPTK